MTVTAGCSLAAGAVESHIDLVVREVEDDYRGSAVAAGQEAAVFVGIGPEEDTAVEGTSIAVAAVAVAAPDCRAGYCALS